MKMLSGASISRSRNWKKGKVYQLTSGERERKQETTRLHEINTRNKSASFIDTD